MSMVDGGSGHGLKAKFRGRVAVLLAAAAVASGCSFETGENEGESSSSTPPVQEGSVANADRASEASVKDANAKPLPVSSETDAAYDPVEVAERRAVIAERLGAQLAEKLVPAQPSEAKPIVELVVDNGATVSWYELAPGAVFIAEKLKYPQASSLKREDLQESSILDLYEHLSGGQAAPESLILLEQRQREMASVYASLRELTFPASVDARRFRPPSKDQAFQETPTITKVAPDVAKLEQRIDESACPHTWLFDVACSPVSGWWVVQRSFRTGTNSFTYEDTNYAEGGACSYRGLIRYTVKYATWYSWTQLLQVTLDTGEAWTGWWVDDYIYDFDIWSNIDQSDGDGFHVCARGFQL